MFLYLMQHALANSKEIDPERGITSQGEVETRKTATFLANLSPNIENIWCSHKKRAIDTANIVADKLGINDYVKECDNLAPKDPTDPIIMQIDKIESDTIIVGHLPYLSNLLDKLTINNNQNTYFKFTNSGIVCLEKIENIWVIQWAVTPKILS